MRILYFSRDFTPHDHRFLTSLAKTEHEVFYLRLEKRGPSREERHLPPQVEQIHWVGGETPARLEDGLRLLLDLKRVLRSVKPDVVHAGPIQTTAFLVALSGYQSLVSMSWGYDLLVDAQRDAYWRWATRFALKRSKVMIGDCNTIRNLAVGYGMPDERIVTFPWGVELNKFSPGESSDRQKIWPSYGAQDNSREIFMLLCNRSWEPIYGVDVIANAFVLASQMLAGRGFPELRLLMLGYGSQAGVLQDIFSRGGFLDRVHFPGHISQMDLPRYYRSSDLYLSASHVDGSSVSLLEALACGLPVLVSDIPGNREWITPGLQGWWFPDGDYRAMAEGIVQAVEQRQLLPEMGLQARQLAEQRANWDRNFTELLRAYELAVGSKKKG
jgi:glycosyltransferase involved in cell wall biosynthesis